MLGVWALHENLDTRRQQRPSGLPWPAPTDANNHPTFGNVTTAQLRERAPPPVAAVTDGIHARNISMAIGVLAAVFLVRERNPHAQHGADPGEAGPEPGGNLGGDPGVFVPPLLLEMALINPHLLIHVPVAPAQDATEGAAAVPVESAYGSSDGESEGDPEQGPYPLPASAFEMDEGLLGSMMLDPDSAVVGGFAELELHARSGEDPGRSAAARGGVGAAPDHLMELLANVADHNAAAGAGGGEVEHVPAPDEAAFDSMFGGGRIPLVPAAANPTVAGARSCGTPSGGAPCARDVMFTV